MNSVLTFRMMSVNKYCLQLVSQDNEKKKKLLIQTYRNNHENPQKQKKLRDIILGECCVGGEELDERLLLFIIDLWY